MRRLGEQQPENSSVLRFEGLEISLDNYQVKVQKEAVPFTPKEVEILHLLASHPGQVLDRSRSSPRSGAMTISAIHGRSTRTSSGSARRSPGKTPLMA
jgi:hypothetical protein